MPNNAESTTNLHLTGASELSNAGDAPIYQNPSYYNEPGNKYELIKDLQAKEIELEKKVGLYLAKHREYTKYMGDRGGEWNDFKQRNDMSGLGLSPGDDNEAAGWFYMGDTDTLAECKRAALRDDKTYTRVVYYDPADGYIGNWKYGCYGSVPSSKTSKNPKFNSIGVTTSDRTYWVDTPNSLALDPTRTENRVNGSAPTPGQNYGGWFSLGKITDASDDADGLYKCKELAKNPGSGAMSYLNNREFVSVSYFGSTYGGSANNSWRGYCYAGVKNAATDSTPAEGTNSAAAGVWASRQTRCLTDDDKPKLIKDLQELYGDILRLKTEINDKFSTIPSHKKRFDEMLNASIYKIQFELQPKVIAYRDAMRKEESEISMLDNLDSHIQLNSHQHKYVIYVAIVVALIAGIYYILTSENDTTYVIYTLFSGLAAISAYYIYAYFTSGPGSAPFKIM
jgi:hypothetical protein